MILCIYNDDISIYATDDMGRISVPLDFSIDITNVQWLKIECTKNNWASKRMQVILDNWKLE